MTKDKARRYNPKTKRYERTADCGKLVWSRRRLSLQYNLAEHYRRCGKCQFISGFVVYGDHGTAGPDPETISTLRISGTSRDGQMIAVWSWDSAILKGAPTC
jgi:hypothetical protein